MAPGRSRRGQCSEIHRRGSSRDRKQSGGGSRGTAAGAVPQSGRPGRHVNFEVAAVAGMGHRVAAQREPAECTTKEVAAEGAEAVVTRLEHSQG